MAAKNIATEFTGFEKDFDRLSSIVERLEAGNATLDEMLKLYEEGSTLASALVATLEKAELKVRTLSQVHEELATFATEPFDEEG